MSVVGTVKEADSSGSKTCPNDHFENRKYSLKFQEKTCNARTMIHYIESGWQQKEKFFFTSMGKPSNAMKKCDYLS